MSAQVASGSIHLDLATITNASTIITHEDYRPESTANDIGLVQLDTPLKFDGAFY